MEKIPNLQLIWVDQGYSGEKFSGSIAKLNQAKVEVVKRKKKEFEVLPRRWVVERTFAWIIQNRRLIVDHEQLPEISEGMIYAAMCRLMIRRLARLPQVS
jgi:putative transposase